MEENNYLKAHKSIRGHYFEIDSQKLKLMKTCKNNLNSLLLYYITEKTNKQNLFWQWRNRSKVCKEVEAR